MHKKTTDNGPLTTDNIFKEYVRYETRRQFLSRGSNAVSWAALAGLLGRDGFVAGASASEAMAGDREERVGQQFASVLWAAAVRTQGQAGDLSAHGRRTAADGYV